jgi:ATP-dependent Lon protease
MDPIELPELVPVMTLPNTVFFPQSLLPLHIFEPRYRAMLREVLATNRLFAVARLDESRLAEPGAHEPPHRVASLGLVRACQEGEDGTSNLLLQGVCRVEVTEIVRELPFRRIRIRPLATAAEESAAALELLRLEVMRLLALRRRLGTTAPKGLAQFLQTIEDVDTFADIAVFNLCEDGDLKQALLEELDPGRRLRRFAARLRQDIARHRLRRKLQGPLGDDDVANN